MKAPTGIAMAAHGTKDLNITGISKIFPVESISLMAASTQMVAVNPTPIPIASTTEITSPFLLAQASARQMMMQFTMMSGTYGPSVSLITGTKAFRNRSAMVTNVAIVSVNMRILRCGFSKFLIRLTTMLLQIITKMTQSPIVNAGLTAAVTASVGHIPSSSRKTGFSSQSPIMNVRDIVGF